MVARNLHCLGRKSQTKRPIARIPQRLIFCKHFTFCKILKGTTKGHAENGRKNKLENHRKVLSWNLSQKTWEVGKCPKFFVGKCPIKKVLLENVLRKMQSWKMSEIECWKMS